MTAIDMEVRWESLRQWTCLRTPSGSSPCGHCEMTAIDMEVRLSDMNGLSKESQRLIHSDHMSMTVISMWSLCMSCWESLDGSCLTVYLHEMMAVISMEVRLSDMNPFMSKDSMRLISQWPHGDEPTGVLRHDPFMSESGVPPCRWLSSPCGHCDMSGLSKESLDSGSCLRVRTSMSMAVISMWSLWGATQSP